MLPAGRRRYGAVPKKRAPAHVRKKIAEAKIRPRAVFIEGDPDEIERGMRSRPCSATITTRIVSTGEAIRHTIPPHEQAKRKAMDRKRSKRRKK